MDGTTEPPATQVTEWSHEAVFPAERQSVGRARGFVASHLIEHRMLRLVDPARLVVDALAAVAIVHSDEPFSVMLSAVGAPVTVGVHDVNGDTVSRSMEALDLTRQRLAAFSLLRVECGVQLDPDGSKYAWACLDARGNGVPTR